MDKKNVIASSLLDNELARAFSELVAERWDNMDLSPFMVYLIDTCSAAALPYLAEQFDIDGLRGFGMATNEEQQRDLIKRSIALHKFIGTPWAIREACRTVGFPVIHLEEGVTYTRKSAYSNAYGTAYNMPTDTFCWACFRVLVEADMARHITAEEARKIRLFVEFYKNERSRLVELGFFQSLVEDNVFRPNTDGRDVLTIFQMSLMPNPVVLGKGGAEQKATINISTSWVIEGGNIIDWEDGTGDKLTLTYSGTAGSGEILITSDINNATEREREIKITTPEGQPVGVLTVRQLERWNAYSRAYSNAYNTFKRIRLNAYSPAYSRAYNNGGAGYIKLSAENLSYAAGNPTDQQIGVISNTDWEIL